MERTLSSLSTRGRRCVRTNPADPNPGIQIRAAAMKPHDKLSAIVLIGLALVVGLSFPPLSAGD